MNGVRRFLTGNAQASQDPPQPPPIIPIAPLSLNTKPPFPPTDNNQTTDVLTESPVSTTSPLSLKKDRPRPQGEAQPQYSSPREGFAQTIVSPRRTARMSPPDPTPPAVDHRNSENAHSTRDELLLSLLASEAVAECQTHEILSSEQVEELKKVCGG